MSRRIEDQRQMDMDALFFETPKAPQNVSGGCDVSLEIREALADTLSRVKVHENADRFEIAARLSRLSGRDIAKSTLDRYSAPNAEDWRFPLEALPALVQATGDYRLLDLVAEACGCKVLRGEEAWIAEFGALLLQQREVKKRLAAYSKSISSDVLQRLEQEAAKRLGGEA